MHYIASPVEFPPCSPHHRIPVSDSKVTEAFAVFRNLGAQGVEILENTLGLRVS